MKRTYFTHLLLFVAAPFFAILSASLSLMACSGRANSSDSAVNPRDTVKVPEGLSGIDSIAYIENVVTQSPITASDLLGLAEIHSVEDRLYYYGDRELDEEEPDDRESILITQRDSAAMRLANRFMRMSHLVYMNGKALDKLQWAVAVNAVLDTLRLAVPSLPADSALYEISRVAEKFSSLTQTEMNFQSYISATVEYYLTIESYRQWLAEVPPFLKTLVQEEYEAWHNLNETRFGFWNDVSYMQEWYSMRPMEVEDYYWNLSVNRRAELDVERDIVLKGKPYQQKGTTVTTKQWEDWIAENSVPADIDLLQDMDHDLIPSDSLVKYYVTTLKADFSRWVAARQAIAAALPKEQGISYDNLTADIHCRIIGKLPMLIPYQMWDDEED